MTTIEVFDPAMCCSTGVCGPTVDPALSRFAADLDWLSAQDVAVTRYNLAQQPAAFVAQPLVTAALETDGEGALPAVLADSKVVSQGRYPTRDELAAWAGLAAPVPAGFVYDDTIDELVAIAAAIAANCEPCLDHHVDAARRLGLPDAAIRRAVETAIKVKDTSARAICRHADQLLSEPSGQTAADGPDAADGGCCAPSPTMITLGVRGAASSSDGCC